MLVRDYIRLAPTFIGIAGGLTLGYETINSNYNQYVDVMTPEQYYRLCGTEPANYD